MFSLWILRSKSRCSSGCLLRRAPPRRPGTQQLKVASGLWLKFDLEHAIFVKAGADGKVDPEHVDKARRELVDSMTTTFQELGRSGSARQKELLD